jgi:hypothetical protein
MKLGQPDTTARRIGPLRAFIGASPADRRGFLGAGEAEISINDADYVACTGTFGEIGGGWYYYYPPIDEVSTKGFVIVKIDGVCDKFELREEIEPKPQGIPAGTTDTTWLHASIRAVIGSAEVLGENFGGAGELEISICGGAWQAVAGTVVEMSGGDYDYIPDATEVATVGWFALKADVVCDQYVIRIDVVDTFTPSATLQFGGRIESRMTAPAGGFSVSATNSGGGPTTCTGAAGNYYLSAAGGVAGLLDTLEDALNASRPPSSGAWTVGLNTSTGLVTVNCTGTWSLTWSNTTLRDVLGFTANITSATTSRTGSKQARSLWFPNCPLNLEGDPDVAPRVTDRRATVGPTGNVLALVGNSMYRQRGIVWSHVPRERVWETAALYGYASFEAFAQDALYGLGHSWLSASSPIQIYYSSAGTPALVGGTYNSGAGVPGWQVLNVNSTEPKKSVGDWTGLWRIELGEIVSAG